MAAPIGVSIAPGDNMLESTPTWVRLDTTDHLVAGFEVTRGRQDEFDKTGTGVARINLNDTLGLFDHTNLLSPYANDLDSIPAGVAIHNPVTDAWGTIFRGTVDDWQATEDPAQMVTYVSAELVDGLAYLAGVELVPNGMFGSRVDNGAIVYDETTGTVDERILTVLGETGWVISTDTAKVLTGNVRLQETPYSAGSTALEVIDEAAEAEFPGIANRYCDRLGRFVFRGRLSRFNPSDPTYDINTWKLGDGFAILDDPDTVQIRALGWRTSRPRIINSALCTPYGIHPNQKAAQTYEDVTSITKNGRRTWSAENLRILESVLTGNNARDECFLYATYYVSKYANPITEVTTLKVRSLSPDDPRAPAVWAFMCGVEISDLITLTTTNPGGGGFDGVQFFVEGLQYRVLPLQPEYEDVELTISVSPRAPWEYAWS